MPRAPPPRGARYAPFSSTYAALRWRAVGTWACQHFALQNTSFCRPVLHDATLHRT